MVSFKIVDRIRRQSSRIVFTPPTPTRQNKSRRRQFRLVGVGGVYWALLCDVTCVAPMGRLYSEQRLEQDEPLFLTDRPTQLHLSKPHYTSFMDPEMAPRPCKRSSCSFSCSCCYRIFNSRRLCQYANNRS